MTTQDQDFWRRMGNSAPGLFDLGAGLYGANAAQKEAKSRVAAAQGPLYNQSMDASKLALDRAGSLDPRAAGAEWLQGQQGLLAGKDVHDEDALFRRLQSTGMLGAANYNPGVSGITPNGTAMNPQMAAFYAARNARDAKLATEAQDRGEGQIDRMLKRSGDLSGQAAGIQNSGVNAQRLVPSRAKQTTDLLRGASGVLGNAGAFKDIGGLFGKGADWLGGATGMWGDPMRNLDLSGLKFGYDDLDFAY